VEKGWKCAETRRVPRATGWSGSTYRAAGVIGAAGPAATWVAKAPSRQQRWVGWPECAGADGEEPWRDEGERVDPIGIVMDDPTPAPQ